MNTATKLKVVVAGDKNTPGALAQELASAAEKKAAKVRKAEDEYAAKRGSVIERGVQRIRDIRVLRAELDEEEQGLTNIVGEV